MTTLHFIFVPYLWFYDEDGDFIEEIRYPTGDHELDETTQEFIANPYFYSLLESLAGRFSVLRYEFMDNLLHVWMEAEADLTTEDLADELAGMDPDEGGRDGWMSGDINVDDNIEFVPKVEKVFIVQDDVEIMVDLTTLQE